MTKGNQTENELPMRRSKSLLRISVEKQTAELWSNGRLVTTFPVSTSKYGVGSALDSEKTPIGRFEIAKKIGGDAPIGAVFKERTFTGLVWPGDAEGSEENEDLILTRILWLHGLEPRNANTRERCIYLHGTNQERALKTPCSHGCVRFSNLDIAQLFDLVEEGTPVEIR